jgi:hypothetical protein
MMLPIPYVTHTPRITVTANTYAVDRQTEEFLQATRLVAGLVGGPAVYYGGSVLASEGHRVLGTTLKVMGVACSVYHLWQYAGVRYAEVGLFKNSAGKPLKGDRLGRLRTIVNATRKLRHINVPDDANIIESE